MMSNPKIALVFENLFSLGGANRVNLEFANMYPDADIYALFGSKKIVEEYFPHRDVKFSFLNRFPFVNKIYTFLLPLWPLAIESFNLSDYDLVISSSHAVAKGCITSESSMHISYVHTPMRYLWDLKDVYSKHRFLKAPLLNYLRVWDVMSSNRPDYIISNSKFVSSRIKRYWGKDVGKVIYPPVDLYKGDLIDYNDREDYFVVGAPFAENKGGEFVIQCAKELGFNLKIIGSGRGEKKLKRLSRGCINIEFLGRVSDDEKFNVIKGAKGFIGCGIEDFGIFPVESISCGTPVLALGKGGYLESVFDGVNGVLYSENILEDFRNGMERLVGIMWDVDMVQSSVRGFGRERFVKEVEEFINNL